eukprot:UN28463
MTWRHQWQVCPCVKIKKQKKLNNFQSSIIKKKPLYNNKKDSSASRYRTNAMSSIENNSIKERLQKNQVRLSQQINELSVQLSALKKNIRNSLNQEDVESDFFKLKHPITNVTSKPLTYRDFPGGVSFRKQSFSLPYNCRMYSFYVIESLDDIDEKSYNNTKAE